MRGRQDDAVSLEGLGIQVEAAVLVLLDNGVVITLRLPVLREHLSDKITACHLRKRRNTLRWLAEIVYLFIFSVVVLSHSLIDCFSDRRKVV